MTKNSSFVVIGGGTGTYSVLSGLKKYTDAICAVVSMADSGGSAKKERDEWGLLPSSDVRKSLIALADISHQDALLLRRLFHYRYSEGVGVAGMSFGNLFLVALTKLLHSQAKAIEKAGELLRIRGRVLPVSLDTVDLVARYEDGTTVVGEHFIDEPKHNGKIKIVALLTKPVAVIQPVTREAIIGADALIIGPGGFYTTILANLVVDGVVDAIKKSKAKKIFIMNLMTEYGQTYGFTASTFLNELDKYLPVSELDYVIVNSAQIPSPILDRYRKTRAEPVQNDLPANPPYTLITADLLSKTAVRQQKGDTLRRSFIRHNPDTLARLCIKAAGVV